MKSINTCFRLKNSCYFGEIFSLKTCTIKIRHSKSDFELYIRKLNLINPVYSIMNNNLNLRVCVGNSKRLPIIRKTGFKCLC